MGSMPKVKLSISMDEELASRVDELAAANGMTRSKLIERIVELDVWTPRSVRHRDTAVLVQGRRGAVHGLLKTALEVMQQAESRDPLEHVEFALSMDDRAQAKVDELLGAKKQPKKGRKHGKR
jgi:predicted transcriptional regulator